MRTIKQANCCVVARLSVDIATGSRGRNLLSSEFKRAKPLCSTGRMYSCRTPIKRDTYLAIKRANRCVGLGHRVVGVGVSAV